jgi:hypothetical protein
MAYVPHDPNPLTQALGVLFIIAGVGLCCTFVLAPVGFVAIVAGLLTYISSRGSKSSQSP